MAMVKMARQPEGQTLQATALVHEAYLKLMGNQGQSWENRRHFFGAAAQAMSQILVDIARRKRACRHGGGHEHVPLDQVEIAMPDPPERFLELQHALNQLAEEAPIEAEIVRLRYFVGLQNAEVAELLSLSLRTVERHWAFAKVWLVQSMKNEKRSLNSGAAAEGHDLFAFAPALMNGSNMSKGSSACPT